MVKQAEKYLEVDAWSIIEKGFHKSKNAVSEFLFSIGNEFCGLRGYAEEDITAPTLRGAILTAFTNGRERAMKGL